MTDEIEPAHRIIPEPTDEQGRPLGWRAADLTDDDLSGDDYAAQFTRHEIVSGSVSVDMDSPVRRTLTATLVDPDAD